jgi:uncharacterized membrane protein YccC
MRRTVNDLARVPFVLAPGGAQRRGWIVSIVAVVGALLAGAAASHLHWSERLGSSQRAAPAVDELRQLAQRLEQAQLQLQLSEARSEELARQIDALSQRLQKALEEVAFFRRAREGRPP